MNSVILLLIVLAMCYPVTGCTSFREQKVPPTYAAPDQKPGEVLNGKNQWRGGVIGDIPGAVAGTTVKEISTRGSREAAQSNKPVEYISMGGRSVYKAYPLDYDDRTKCHRIQEKVWDDGKLIIDQTREVCGTDKAGKK